MSKIQRTSRHEISAFMHNHVRDHIDPLTGEVNCTGLAEATAHALGHDEWLDDPDHKVWEMAVHVANSI